MFADLGFDFIGNNNCVVCEWLNMRMQDFAAYEDSSAKSGFWGVLARKAKAILEEEDAEFQQNDASGGIRSSQPLNASGGTTQVKLILIYVFIYNHIYAMQHITT